MRFRERASSTRFRCVMDDLAVNQQQLDRVGWTTAQGFATIIAARAPDGTAAEEVLRL